LVAAHIARADDQPWDTIATASASPTPRPAPACTDDTSGPHDDWKQHMTDVEHRSVPIPEDATALLDQLRERLDVLADDAPLAALSIITALESTIAEAGAVAAHAARADDQSWDTIATGLGLTESKARSRLHRYARAY